VAKSASKKILDNAKAWGAEAIVTTCPLCQYNLDKLRAMTDGSIPVFYFTQLLGVAVGLGQDELGLEHNAGDPVAVLKSKGLL